MYCNYFCRWKKNIASSNQKVDYKNLLPPCGVLWDFLFISINWIEILEQLMFALTVRKLWNIFDFCKNKIFHQMELFLSECMRKNYFIDFPYRRVSWSSRNGSLFWLAKKRTKSLSKKNSWDSNCWSEVHLKMDSRNAQRNPHF